MFEEAKEKSQGLTTNLKSIAMPFAISGIAPVLLLLLGLIESPQLLWVYIAVFATVMINARLE